MKSKFFLIAALAALSGFAAEYPYAVPGFASASIYAAAGKDGTGLEYRKAGSEEWLPAQSLVLSPDKKELRGSLFKLDENTNYEYRIGDGKTGKFRTQSVKVPIARTIMLTNENFKGYLKLTESGTAKGYVRYTAAPDTILQADFKHKEAILAENVRYVILDGLTIRGGGHHILHLKNCENFQVVNCDLGDYGTFRIPLVFPQGKTPDELAWSLHFVNGHYVQNQTPIAIYGGKNILIERNFLHDPRCHANSWFYTHPWGPSGLHYGKASGLTIRWNNIIGSDHHRWNDVIESAGNGDRNGGPNANAEIYGNYLAFCNDDAIELDGGQKNVRYFDNWMENTFCGVSTAPCMEGPSYVINNFYLHPGDEFGAVNAAIKNGDFTYYTGRIHVYGNTFSGLCTALSSFNRKIPAELANELKTVVKNNLFIRGSQVSANFWNVASVVDYNVFAHPRYRVLRKFPKAQVRHNAEGKFPLAGEYQLKNSREGENLANVGSKIGASGNLPERPLQLETSKMWLDLKSSSLTGKVTLKSTGYSGKFQIVQPKFSPFFKVTPGAGSIKAGESLTLTVTALPGKAPEARRNCGAFLIRTPDGLARPVAVYFDNRDDLAKVRKMRRNLIYGKVVSGGKNRYTVKFKEVPQGDYYLAINLDRLPWYYNVTLPGAKPYKTGAKTGEAGQTTGWVSLPWNALYSRNFPRRIEGDFSCGITIDGDNQYNILNCALMKTPEELLSASITVLPEEKTTKVSKE